jgi:16S rRNA (cytosine1402-N4)-methyltransferase
VAEVVRLLSGKAVVIDTTVGAGGHAEALLEAGVQEVIGIDRDPAAIDEAAGRLARFGRRFRWFCSPFSLLSEVARREGFRAVGGVLFDLGVSSMQLEEPDRGFSYRSAGPLDMRMGAGDELLPTAAQIVNSYPEDDLARVIFEFGGERFSRRIAAAIARARSRGPIVTTEELAAIVAAAVPRRRGGPHPARRTFQAVRIVVNRELEELAASLPQAVSLLEPGGRLVAISYHSLEDRVVKRFLAGNELMELLNRKPVVPSQAERATNPRARSAKLRAAQRIREAA